MNIDLITRKRYFDVIKRILAHKQKGSILDLFMLGKQDLDAIDYYLKDCAKRPLYSTSGGAEIIKAFRQRIELLEQGDSEEWEYLLDNVSNNRIKLFTEEELAEFHSLKNFFCNNKQNK